MASSSAFTEIPLSPPVEEIREEEPDTVKASESTRQTSQLLSRGHQSSLLETSDKSNLTKTQQSSLNLSTVGPHVEVNLTETNREKISEEDGTQGAELEVGPQPAEFGNNLQLWSQSFAAPQFEEPSAPALYPSLAALEDSPVIQLCKESVKICTKEPAVLALPEQDSSPPSLQPLESIADLSRNKLYPELPSTAPELQVLLCILI